MPQPPKISIFSLSANPLETVCYKVKKPFQALLGTVTGMLPVNGKRTHCTIFESISVEMDEEVFINGKREVILIRGNKHWPFRVLPTAMNTQLLAYPQVDRSHIARLKPLQSCLASGYLSYSRLVGQEELNCFKGGVAQELSNSDIRAFTSAFDLIKSCVYTGDEWRLIRPLAELRHKLISETATG